MVTRFVFSELFAKAWMASMTMPNIISGFHHSGVYPVDRSKVIHQVEQISGSKSVEDTGIVYVPVLTPTPRVKSSKTIDITTYSREEIAQNHERSLRGCHAITDPKYSKWLQMYRPLALSQSPLPSSYDSSIMHTPVQKDHGHGSLSGMLALAKPTSSIQHLLHYPSSPLYFPSTSPKKSSRILTISENVRIVMDKRIKEENAEIKNKNN